MNQPQPRKTDEKKQWCDMLVASIFVPRPEQTVSDWCHEHLQFNEPNNHSAFEVDGREYIREPLDSFADYAIVDLVLVWGSQLGKTGLVMGGVAWRVANMPTRIVWGMPSIDLARKFSGTRWIPMLRASPALSKLIPTGRDRFAFKTTEQRIGGSIVDFTGSNSAANLSSTPAPMTVADETDKFDCGGNEEADALNLLEQRTKNSANPFHVKTSTPTLVDGIIWQELLKGDIRRLFMPCPHCQQTVVFGWSKQYTSLPLTGSEAWVKWDQEAKAESGWDFARVESSAHFECPHCHGKIQDHHKRGMLKRGEWRATKTTEKRVRSYHLSSLYGTSPSCNIGKLAVKFLKSKHSLQGVQGFVNGDLAEIWQNQDNLNERIELVTPPDAKQIDGATRLLTVDCQRLAPYFFYIVREWKDGNSRLLDYGSCDQEEALVDVQTKWTVLNHHVLIDSGDDSITVYDMCLRHGKICAAPDSLPLHVGWLPSKGRERQAVWKDKQTGNPCLYFMGRAPVSHRKFILPLFEFNSQICKDILWRLRRKKTTFKWEVLAGATEEYYHHLDSEYKPNTPNRRTGRMQTDWVKRAQRWPNHWLDCENEQVPLAMFHKLCPVNEIQTSNNEQQPTETPKH